jgi:CHC2 zinc finger
MTDQDSTFKAAADVTIERASAQQRYQGGFMIVNPERWTRITDLIRFEDVVGMFVDRYHHQQVISCPFHGRDSKPSFHLYRRSNDAYCFGCPNGKGYYDHVRFVAAMHGGSMLGALKWLEREFKLPKMRDVNSEQYADDHAEEFVTVRFRDLLEPYIQHAARDVALTKDIDLAKEYLEILFCAWPTPQEEKVDPDAGDALALARVVGRKVWEPILVRKQYPKL